jgi:hypothetical protein
LVAEPNNRVPAWRRFNVKMPFNIQSDHGISANVFDQLFRVETLTIIFPDKLTSPSE